MIKGDWYDDNSNSDGSLSVIITKIQHTRHVVYVTLVRLSLFLGDLAIVT